MAKPAVRRCIQSGFEYGIVILVAEKNSELNYPLPRRPWRAAIPYCCEISVLRSLCFNLKNRIFNVLAKALRI